MMKVRSIRGLALLSTCAALPAPALAQTAPAPATGPASAPAPALASVATDAPGDDGIQDIIVTAQRRSESLQKTSLSITVVQPQAIANAGVTSPLQLTAILPSIQVGNSGPAPSVYVRGVGSYSSTALNSPAIPFYIDGTYLARSQSVTSEFYDVDRLEALKGPQGTLYGRNASGGAINILTRRPELGSFATRGQFEVGNYGNQTGEVAINLPLGDTVALRTSAQVVDKGGYTSENFGDDVHQSGRVKLLWQPRADMSLLLNGSVGHIGGNGPATVLLNRNVPGWYPWLDSTSPQGQALILSTGPAGPPGLLRAPNPADALQDLDFWNVSADFNWNLGPATLTILPSYRHARMRYNGLFTFLYANGSGFGVFDDRPEISRQTSVEVRLSGNGDRLKWVAGLYYFNEAQFQEYELNGGQIEHLGVTADFGTRSYAAFGQATLSVSDRLRLIGGVRYTSDRRTLTDGSAYFANPSLLGPNGVPCVVIAPTPGGCLADTFTGRKTFENVSWKGGIEADVLTDSLFYATASRGFKAGGFNTQTDPVTRRALLFKPEVLTSYEAGLKNRFLDNRLQVNIEGFYWDYDNHQEPKVSTTAAGSINLVYFNAGKSRIYGGDVEVVARPWRGGTLTLSVEYANSKYKEFTYTQAAAFTNVGCPTRPTGGFDPNFGPIVTVDCSGYQIARAPKWSGSAGVTQRVPVGDAMLVGNVNATFASARWLSIEFVPLERARAYATVDAALIYQPAGGRWTVGGFVRNLNNGRSYTFATPSPFSAAIAANIGAPRTYGGQVSFNF